MDTLLKVVEAHGTNVGMINVQDRQKAVGKVDGTSN
jgi:hypothetical protein